MANLKGRLTIPGTNITINTDDEQVKVSSADTTAGFLFDKVTSGDGSVTFVVSNPGGIEQLDIRSTGGSGTLEYPCIVGSVRDIDDGETLSAVWGINRATAGVTFMRAGELVGLSVTLDAPIAGAGSIDFRACIDGIEQTGVGQTMNLVFTGPTQNTSLEFGTAIAVSANQVVDLVCVASGGLTPSSIDATVAIWYRLL